MATRKTWIARQQTTAGGRDRTGTFDQPFDAGHVQYWRRRHDDIADDDAPAAGNTQIDSGKRGDDCDAATVENRYASTVEQSRNPSGSVAKVCKILVSRVVAIAELRSATPIIGTMPHNMAVAITTAAALAILLFFICIIPVKHSSPCRCHVFTSGVSPEKRRIVLQGTSTASPTRTPRTAVQRKYGIPAQKIPERCENRSWRSKRKARNMTEPTALTIRHMKIEDYPLVYGLWTRCTGFTMRDIDDCKDAIKTFLKRNPDTCFVAEDDGGRIIGAILAGHDGRRSRIYHTAVDPTRAVGALARCWWAVWLKRFVRSAAESRRRCARRQRCRQRFLGTAGLCSP
mgnify:CR=1 FL=1